MEFRLKFVGKSEERQYFSALAFSDCVHIGVEGVDFIKKELGCELPIGKIKPFQERKHICIDLEITIPIEIARESGLFSTSNRERVLVPHNYCEQFYSFVVEKEEDRITGEITLAWVKAELDEKKLLEAWKEAGFPIEWGF